MRKLLVTGGCGFIGSHFIRETLRTRPDIFITNLDKLTYSGNVKNVSDLKDHPRYRFVKGDIVHQKKVNALMRSVWAVVHFAAETHVDRAIENASAFLNTNVLGTHRLLEAACRNRIKRFLHISTDEVYGSVAKGEVNENALLRPNNPYSASKAAGDHLVRSYFITHRLPVLVARSSNNFGPFQFPEKVIPLFMTNLIENKKVPLYGKGRQMRDWLFVLDNVRALDIILNRGKIGEVYNVGAGCPISNLILTIEILKLFNKRKKAIRYVPDRPGHDFRYSLDISKLSRLGFKPRFSFAEALRQTARWYWENERWWKPLKKDPYASK